MSVNGTGGSGPRIGKTSYASTAQPTSTAQGTTPTMSSERLRSTATYDSSTHATGVRGEAAEKSKEQKKKEAMERATAALKEKGFDVNDSNVKEMIEILASFETKVGGEYTGTLGAFWPAILTTTNVDKLKTILKEASGPDDLKKKVEHFGWKVTLEDVAMVNEMWSEMDKESERLQQELEKTMKQTAQSEGA
jgi:hypothetical protein